MLNKKKILLVDDLWSIRNSLSSGLQREGFQVEISSTAEQALFKLNETQFDVLLTDLQMPHISGCVLASIVKELYPNTKIIIMSAYDLEELQKQYKDLGEYPYLSKPFKITQLFNLLNTGHKTLGN